MRAVFEALLGRPAGPDDDLSPWIQAIAADDSIGSRTRVVEAIVASEEYRGRLIDAAYLSDLGRSADPNGHRYWTRRLADTSLSGVRARLLTSHEALASDTTDEEAIRRIFAAALGREPDPRGAAYWLRWLERGGSRTGFALRVLRSREAARGTVADTYQQLLDRPPTAAELDRWVPIVAAQDLRPLVVALLASDERWSSTI